MQGAGEELQQTLQDTPKTLSQGSQLRSPRSYKISEGRDGGLSMAFCMRRVDTSDDENRLFFHCLKKAGGRWIVRRAGLCY